MSTQQPTTLTDLFLSVWRTLVPYAVAFVVAKATEWGIAVDESVVTGQFVALGGTLWYVVVRVLEQKFPQAGWLIGAPKAPAYPPKEA